jgi:hypothetical protein
MVREFFAPRVMVLFVVLWAILWGAMLLYIRSTKEKRARVIRHATAPIFSAIATFVVVVVFLAALTYFN